MISPFEDIARMYSYMGGLACMIALTVLLVICGWKK